MVGSRTGPCQAFGRSFAPHQRHWPRRPRCSPASLRSTQRALAVATGTVTFHEPAPHETMPTCAQIMVDVLGANDNHFIASAHGITASDGTCRYAISVPADSPVWFRVRPVLVADARIIPFDTGSARKDPATNFRYASRGSVQLQWTVQPTTYTFAANEKKTIALTY